MTAPRTVDPARRETLIAERAERRRRHRALGDIDRELRALTHADLLRTIAAAASRSARDGRTAGDTRSGRDARRRRPLRAEHPDLFDTRQESAA